MKFRIGQRVEHSVEGVCVVLSHPAVFDGREFVFVRSDGWEGWASVEDMKPLPPKTPLARWDDTWGNKGEGR